MDTETINKLSAAIAESITHLNNRIETSSSVDAEKVAGAIRNLAGALLDLNEAK